MIGPARSRLARHQPGARVPPSVEPYQDMVSDSLSTTLSGMPLQAPEMAAKVSGMVRDLDSRLERDRLAELAQRMPCGHSRGQATRAGVCLACDPWEDAWGA